jgi:chemotaxis protein methyltransferase CheR
VSFQYHNLVEHPYPSIVHGIAALDLILCRNVMIYFDWAAIAHILDRFHECLVDGGWLAVGHAESNTEVFRRYQTVNVPGATLYQKNGKGPSAISHVPSAPPDQIRWQATADVQQPWSPPVLPAISDAPGPRVGQPRVTPQLSELALIRRLADEGGWSDAAQRCENLLEHDRLNPVAHFYRALIMEQTSRRADAEQSFRRALYLDRGFVLAHYHLALLLDRSGRRESAIQSLRNVETLLARMDTNAEIGDADGLTVDDLSGLVDMHLDLWRK